MKLCLAILLTFFISIEAYGSRVKRGLSADEQKKFLDELNKDRKKIAEDVGFQFVPMKYNSSLEKEIVSGKECSKVRQQLPLRINDVAEEIRRHFISSGTEGDIYGSYFRPYYDKIGCSKKAKCTEVLEKHNETPLELQGKTIEYYGLCALRSNEAIVGISEAQFKKLRKAKTPSPNKYADILGIPGGNQGSGMDGTNGKQGSGVGMTGKNGADGEQGSGAGTHGSRLKRGFSEDELKKFLEELNKDRKKLAQEEGFEFVPMRYDARLEEDISPFHSCWKNNENKGRVPLRINDVAEELRKYLMDGSTGENDIYNAYFDPVFDLIGCSKKTTCTEVLDAPPKFVGKTIEYHGICLLGVSGSERGKPYLKKGKGPSPNKYADILGIRADSGAGSVFSLIISLFLVLYI